MLAKQAQQMKFLAETFSIPIVVSNQVLPVPRQVYCVEQLLEKEKGDRNGPLEPRSGWLTRFFAQRGDIYIKIEDFYLKATARIWH